MQLAARFKQEGSVEFLRQAGLADRLWRLLKNETRAGEYVRDLDIDGVCSWPVVVNLSHFREFYSTNQVETHMNVSEAQLPPSFTITTLCSNPRQG
jgi:hypothetical protein